MIELNLTFLYQVIGFFVLYFILNTFLFQPILKTLEERDKAIAGTKKEAEVSEIELQKKLLDYENRINEAKAKAYEERLRIRQQGLDKEREIIENARKDAQDSLLQAKTKLGQDVVTILARLKQESKIISKGIAEKILDRKVA
ncbi:MAG TPA: ATP synthase F0 subunit B [Thermodesulfobacteriota bacterium]|nr:ATP synthase F0 subunit B [Thermodesulfobacteriota bacterium]